MEEINRVATHEIKIETTTLNNPDVTEEQLKNLLLAQAASKLADYIKRTENEDGSVTFSMHFVSLDPENYGDLKETEWMYKDLNDESEDNAQLDEEEVE